MIAGKAPIVAVPPEQREAIESIIMEAFLAGTDDNFDRLLEVCNLTLYRFSRRAVIPSIIDCLCCCSPLHDCAHACNGALTEECSDYIFLLHHFAWITRCHAESLSKQNGLRSRDQKHRLNNLKLCHSCLVAHHAGGGY